MAATQGPETGSGTNLTSQLVCPGTCCIDYHPRVCCGCTILLPILQPYTCHLIVVPQEFFSTDIVQGCATCVYGFLEHAQHQASVIDQRFTCAKAASEPRMGNLRSQQLKRF